MIKDIEKLDAVGLREYITNLDNYHKTKMKQHQVLLYTRPISEQRYPNDNLENKLTDILFKTTSRPSDIAMDTQARVICYHDTAFHNSFPYTQAIDRLVRLNSGEPISSKSTYMPTEFSPVLTPTVATWIDTKQKYWVLFLPITNDLLSIFGNVIINEQSADLMFLLYGIVLVLPDLDGKPNMQEPMWLTLNQFKGIFNCAGLQKPVEELEQYILAKQRRICKIQSQCSQKYKEKFQLAPITDERVKALFAPVGAYPIKAEELKEHISQYSHKIARGLCGYADYIYEYTLASSDIRVKWYSVSLPHYPAFRESVLKIYGPKFLRRETALITLRQLLEKGQRVEDDELIYATLSVDTWLHASKGAGYKYDYPLWAGSKLHYIVGTNDRRMYSQVILDFSLQDKVKIYAGCYTDKGIAHNRVCLISVPEYIAMLEYIQHNFEGQYADIGILIGEIICFPDKPSGFDARAKQALSNPSAFVRGNKTLTTIFRWLKKYVDAKASGI